MKEEWKWVEGFEGIYQISNLGNLKSFKQNKEGHVLKNTNQHGWYFTVNLSDSNGKKLTTRIHILVAKHFIGEIPKGYHVHHKDGNRQNNVVSNLEIIHPSKHWYESEKRNHAIIKGLNDYNRYVKTQKIRQYTLDGIYLAEYVNGEVASRMTGICQRNILQVANKTPYGKNKRIRKQAGGYIWKLAEAEVV